MTTQDFQVCSAGVFGMFATSVGWATVGEVLDILLRVCQIGVAAVTILYIYSKWRAARASKKIDDDESL